MNYVECRYLLYTFYYIFIEMYKQFYIKTIVICGIVHIFKNSDQTFTEKCILKK